MRRVYQNRQVALPRDLDLHREVAFFGRRLVVEAYFADRDDTLLLEPARQERDDVVGDARIVRLLGVERQGAEVPHAELRRAEAFPPDERREVVLERPDVRARLTEPERRLDHDCHARGRHRQVVVGRARGHVDVWVEKPHQSPPVSRRSRSAGTPRPAARRSLA